MFYFFSPFHVYKSFVSLEKDITKAEFIEFRTIQIRNGDRLDLRKEEEILRIANYEVCNVTLFIYYCLRILGTEHHREGNSDLYY